jgi:uncharacterized small protein (DUF1192 family)
MGNMTLKDVLALVKSGIAVSEQWQEAAGVLAREVGRLKAKLAKADHWRHLTECHDPYPAAIATLREDNERLQAELNRLDSWDGLMELLDKNWPEEEKAMKGTLTGRCPSCLEHHPEESICPPHEVRTTGKAWRDEYLEELEIEAARLKAALADAQQEIIRQADTMFEVGGC